MFLWLKQLKAPRNYVVKSPLTHYPIMSQRGLTPDVLDLQLQTFSIWPGDTNLFAGQPWSNWKSYGHCHGYQRITRGYRKPECFYQLRFKTEMSYSFPFSHFWKQSNHLRKLECNRMYHTFSVQNLQNVYVYIYNIIHYNSSPFGKKHPHAIEQILH